MRPCHNGLPETFHPRSPKLGGYRPLPTPPDRARSDARAVERGGLGLLYRIPTSANGNRVAQPFRGGAGPKARRLSNLLPAGPPHLYYLVSDLDFIPPQKSLQLSPFGLR